MPIVLISCSLAYPDRANFGFACTAGINRGLGISHGLSSLMGALFFLGYFLFQIPGAICAECRGVKKRVFVSLILWGGCAVLRAPAILTLAVKLQACARRAKVAAHG